MRKNNSTRVRKKRLSKASQNNKQSNNSNFINSIPEIENEVYSIKEFIDTSLRMVENEFFHRIADLKKSCQSITIAQEKQSLEHDKCTSHCIELNETDSSVRSF